MNNFLISFCCWFVCMNWCIGMDMLGCTIVGTITAIGGGTIRDLLIGNAPVFWAFEYEYIWLCLATCGATFLSWDFLTRNDMIKEDSPFLSFADSIGLGAFCVIGNMLCVCMIVAC